MERLEAEITELAGHLAAAECRWFLLVAEYDRRAGHEAWGCRSCAHWLSWHCGLDMRAARERVRVARSLEDLPLVTAEFAAGKLSFSKVRALTRVATAANEAELVMLAEHSTAVHVEKIVRSYRGASSSQEELDQTNARHAARYLRYEWTDDGSLKGYFQIPPELGAIFVKALEAAREQVPADAVEEDGPAGPSCEPAATNCDALVMVAESWLANGPAARTGGDRYQIVLNVDEDALNGDAGGVCELDDGPAIASETVRRLACDASIVMMRRDKSGQLVQVNIKTRTIPVSTRRAVRRRDKGCRFPGCGNRAFIDVHHVHHQARGGSHDKANLMQLCWHHHRLVHEGGWSVRFDDRGEVLAIRPNGNVLGRPRRPEPCGPRNVVSGNRARGVSVDSTTCVPRWRGESLDLGLVVAGLFEAEERAALE